MGYVSLALSRIFAGVVGTSMGGVLADKLTSRWLIIAFCIYCRDASHQFNFIYNSTIISWTLYLEYRAMEYEPCDTKWYYRTC